MAEKTLPRKPEWMWWQQGECVVRLLKQGHFPTSVMVELPNGQQTEVELEELGDGK